VLLHKGADVAGIDKRVILDKITPKPLKFLENIFSQFLKKFM